MGACCSLLTLDCQDLLWGPRHQHSSKQRLRHVAVLSIGVPFPHVLQRSLQVLRGHGANHAGQSSCCIRPAGALSLEHSQEPPRVLQLEGKPGCLAVILVLERPPRQQQDVSGGECPLWQPGVGDPCGFKYLNSAHHTSGQCREQPMCMPIDVSPPLHRSLVAHRASWQAAPRALFCIYLTTCRFVCSFFNTVLGPYGC